ncbi:DUF433 domain-containing protein [Micromonospora carbonacea]|uniref:Uncharacterized conserved protein, DUF433 family n=1 Tax=Micromonospora carbonacea TaxID=47853 RepID=A0A1C5AA92_9ACTN|nr:DUF433 domain-containing protein [Micromonospora carbonacea]SCF41934.1 Uncharacterized conserved protein, DUF433 family [Micromonospora carbonacea]
MTAEPRPTIVIDPAVRFGYPHLRGIPTDAVAGMVWAGETVETVCGEYDMTRHEVLLCCWREGLQGEYRRQWRVWAEAAHPVLAGWARLVGRDAPASVDTIPDPPSRVDLGEATRR